MNLGRSNQKQANQKKPAGASGKSALPKLHSVGALLKGREFVGSFEVGGSAYNFTYAPSKAALVGRRLQLTGSLTVIDARQSTRPQPHSQKDVRATLVGIQGGIGSAPPRKKPPAEVYPALAGVPPVESTGSLSFAGVLYFHFEPLVGSAIGLKADVSRLQLNARLYPVDDKERALQAAYSQASDALLGKQIDQPAADEAVSELNKLLAA